MHSQGPYALVLALTVLLLVAVTAVRLANRTGLPSLLRYLGLGLVIGEAGLGLHFEDALLTANLGLAALAIILAEGGLTTRWASIRPVLGLAAVLATVGVAVSVAVVTLAYPTCSSRSLYRSPLGRWSAWQWAGSAISS